MSLKMMCIGAHPDDECFAFGGALALAAGRGMETYVLCLTDGQAATYRGDAVSGEELGKVRREEFAASCKILEVAEHELLDYQDGKLEFLDFSAAAGKLVLRMRQFKPDIVITFGGEGGLNAHPDHMVVSALTTAAFHWCGREKRYPETGAVYQPKRLFHISANSFLPERQKPFVTPWTVKLDIRTVKEQKSEAFRQHVSQGPLMESTKDMFAQYGSEEYYTLVACEGVGPARLTDDLFEGLG